MTVTAEVNDLPGRITELLRQVQEGNEVVLIQGNKPVARLIPALDSTRPPAAIQIRSIKGHQVLTPIISQSEVADEMLGQK
jgi:prevent-host-death family protein